MPWPESVDDETLSCLNSWPAGTVGYANDVVLIHQLNELCKVHGYGRIGQLAAAIEEVWRGEEEAVQKHQAFRDERMELLKDSIARNAAAGLEQNYVFKQVSAAYNEKTRNLGFRASEAVTPAVAKAIMEKACNEYNGFYANVFDFFPDDCTITLAREGSVCIYVRPGKKALPTAEKLGADEYNVMEKTTFGRDHRSGFKYDSLSTPYGGFEGEVRIWWD